MDGDRIGLTINDEDVYIVMDELHGVSIKDNECVIKSEVMELYIISQTKMEEGVGDLTNSKKYDIISSETDEQYKMNVCLIAEKGGYI